MKHRLLPIFFALVFVFGCSKGGNQVRVVSAVYGVSTNFTDVSRRVEELFRLGSGFEVHPNFLQADPMSGYNKFLVVVYEAKGRRQIFTASEGDLVSAEMLLTAAK